MQKVEEIEEEKFPKDEENKKLYFDLKISPSYYETKSDSKAVTLEYAVNHNKKIMLEGEMGSGKSSLFLEYCRRISIVRDESRESIIPIILDFSERKVSDDFRIDDLLNDLSNKAQRQLGVIGSESIAKTVFLIDGLEEAGKALHDENLYSLLDAILAYQFNWSSQTHVAFATRPYGRAQSYLAQKKDVVGFQISSFTLTQMIRLVQASCRSVLAPRILEDLHHSQLLHQLPQTPISAILLSKVISELKDELPSSVTELYSQATENMLGRWDVEKGLIAQRYYKTAVDIVLDLAEYFYEHNLSRIAILEAHDRLDRYLSKRNTGIESEELKRVVYAQSKIFSFDDHNDTISFKHNSYLEFFVAKARANKRDPRLKANPFFDPERQILFFYAGLLRDCKPFLESMAEKPVDTTVERWNKSVALCQFMLAGFTTEYVFVEQTLPGIFLELAQSYLDERGRGESSAFSDLPEIHVLMLLQTSVRHKLGYSFFKPALENTFIEVEDHSEAKPITKAYAMYFASVVAKEIGMPDPFDFLLKTFKESELPLPISLMIDIEYKVNDSDKVSALVNRRCKKIKKIKNGKAGRESMVSMRDAFITRIGDRKNLLL